jgi:type IV pilus assembly protein PilW
MRAPNSTCRRTRTARLATNSRGFSLMELMVGVVIGLIATLIIFQVFAVSEGLKRNTTAAGDAQTTGLISSFILGQELGNAGSAMMAALNDLSGCPSTGNFKTNLRPIPVVIYDGGADDISDSVDVYYSVARTLITPALFINGPFAPGVDFQVQSPTKLVAGVPQGGFNIGDLAVALDGVGGCELTKITGATPEVGANPTGTTGSVTLKHTAVVNAYGGPLTAGLMPLGPVGAVQKMHYDVTPPADPVSPNVLRGQSLLDPVSGLPDVADVQPKNPIAGNIVLLKVQYGISNLPGPNSHLDTWVKAVAPWDAATLLGPLPATTLAQTVEQIKAVRIGIIVRSDQPVTALDANGSDFQKYVTNGFDWVLFDCPLVAKAGCPGRLTGHLGAYNGQFYRYRIYQLEIPLRNGLWNE